VKKFPKWTDLDLLLLFDITPDWQDERPPAPSYLRVLYLGKILQDDDTLARMYLLGRGCPKSNMSDILFLTELKFPSYTPPEPATPTIVHLSIRSFVPREDSTVKKKRRTPRPGIDASRGREDGSANERDGVCCCIIC
jgi:hypothetical protein